MKKNTFKYKLLKILAYTNNLNGLIAWVMHFLK